MIYNYSGFVRYLSLLLILTTTCFGISVSGDKTVWVLEKSSIYIDIDELEPNYITKNALFSAYHKPYINIGMSKDSVWVSFVLENQTPQEIKKVLVVTSPLLEHISLYQGTSSNNPSIRGHAHITPSHHTLNYYFPIVLAPNSEQQFYLKASSNYTPIDFALLIQDKNIFLKEDQNQQLTDMLLIGIIIALMIYSFLLSFFIKSRSYLYYSLYLFALLYQQITYLGITQIYFWTDFVAFDMRIPVIKVTILIIFSALFAMRFLKSETIKPIHRIYKIFIALSLIEMLIFNTQLFFNMDIVIFTGALFIIFNLIAGIISYKKGHIEARLFIVGFSVVFLSYAVIILDAIGLTSIMQSYQNLLMWSTAIEAIILSLAFADRYMIMAKAKKEVDRHMLQESINREKIIQNEVDKKTSQLNHALSAKELLLEEVHHRVKNNLQIILSIIRLQGGQIVDDATKEKMVNLENRINSIAKTYDSLLIGDNLEEIDMQDYIDTLILDIQKSLSHTNIDVLIRKDINAVVPLSISVYIGLIINELVTNSYKYAFEYRGGVISIYLHQDGDRYTLTIEDNGKGFKIDQNQKTLGLKLIRTLVYDQLGGEMEIQTDNNTKYTIRFSA